MYIEYIYIGNRNLHYMLLPREHLEYLFYRENTKNQLQCGMVEITIKIELSGEIYTG